MTQEIGSQLGHFQITAHIGKGGMGVVYKAVDTHLDRPAAIKLLPPDLTRDEDARRRFMREAKAASALDHANICTIYEVGETPDGQLFLAMAYYDGATLEERLTRGPLTPDDAVDIATQVARGLARAHDSGIIHRDIKPANIMLTSQGDVKILDFGVAKLLGQTRLTMTGTFLGTAAYMSPEQVRGEEIDTTSDLWSLGVVLYEMLTGVRPFSGDGIVHDLTSINMGLSGFPNKTRGSSGVCRG